MQEYEDDDNPYGLEPEEPAAPRRTPAPPTVPGAKGAKGEPVVVGSTALPHAPRRRRSDVDAEVAAETARQAYMSPAITMLVALSISSVMVFLSAGVVGVIAHQIGFVICVTIAVGVFLVCCLFGLGFDAPIRLLFLQIGAAYAISSVMSALIGFSPIGCFGLWLLPLIVFVMALSRMCDLEMTEAWIVGLLTYAAQIALVFALMAIL